MTKYGSFSYTPFVMDNNVAHHNTIMTIYYVYFNTKINRLQFSPNFTTGIPYPQHKGHESV
jgi:hypothetical protein